MNSLSKMPSLSVHKNKPGYLFKNDFEDLLSKVNLISDFFGLPLISKEMLWEMLQKNNEFSNNLTIILELINDITKKTPKKINSSITPEIKSAILLELLKEISGITDDTNSYPIIKIFDSIYKNNGSIPQNKKIPIFRIFVLCTNFLSYQAKLLPILVQQTPENLAKIEDFFSKSENIGYSQDKDIIFYIIENNLLDNIQDIPSVEVIKLAIQVKKKIGVITPLSVLSSTEGQDLMRVALISQKEIQLLARLLGTGNIEAYLSYKEFKKFQEEVGEDLAFLQSCHSKYTELQAFAVKDFEQELENPHLENTKILLCEVAEYVDLNRKLLNNKKENLDLLNQLYDILASHYKILDPNFNTADLFKVLENIWSFDIEAIKKIIELFEDFVIIDNCNLLLDKSNLEKILKYSNLIGKGEKLSVILEIINMQIDDENQKKQLTLPNTDTTFNLNNKENSLKIPKYEEPEELEQPEQLSLIPQNEIDKIIIDTINSGNEDEKERVGKIISETFKGCRTPLNDYGKNSSTQNKGAGKGCGHTLKKFLNPHLNRFSKNNNESYSEYLERISHISFEDFDKSQTNERIKQFNSTPGIFFTKLTELEECLRILDETNEKHCLAHLIANYQEFLKQFEEQFKKLFIRKVDQKTT